MVVVVLGFLLGYVWERVDIVRVGYRLEQLRSQKTLLERERDELSVKLAALSAPDRIARVAREKLGMTPPQQGQIVVVHRAEPKRQSPVTPQMEVQVARSEAK
jgi:cell division protein FtsL